MPNNKQPSFLIRDCALVALATGRKAQLLREFRQHLALVETASIYNHFWGSLLQARFEVREYNNDFAAWVRHGLHDGVLAERLAALAPTDYDSLETLRQVILDLIDDRIEDVEPLAWVPATQPFHFVCSQIVVFNTSRCLASPDELANALESMSTTSIFYHFIDARRRTDEHCDDFSKWLQAYGEEYAPLRQRLAGIDPYFGSLGELRQQLYVACNEYLQEMKS